MTMNESRTTAGAAGAKDDSAAEATAESVGARIRARRKKVVMKQATLAQEAGISAAQLCHIEKCEARPSIRTLEKIALALGTTVGTLLEGADAPPRASGVNIPDHGDELPENALSEGTPAGDALASDALARGGYWRRTACGSHGVNSPTIEPVTGLWRIHLTVKDTAGNVVAGGDDLADGYSSLYWEVTI
jgi:transcriptional regulator with XRE-family HTH domain